jgi:hypothetical protein
MDATARASVQGLLSKLPSNYGGLFVDCCRVLPLEHEVRKQQHTLRGKQAGIHGGEAAAVDGGRYYGLLQVAERGRYAALAKGK